MLLSGQFGMMDIPDPMTPRQQGLLSTGLGLLQASGPSRMPVTFGQALGRAGQMGMDRANAAEQTQMNRAIQIETLRSQDAIRKAQAAQLEEVVAERQRKAKITQAMIADMNEGLQLGLPKEVLDARRMKYVYELDPMEGTKLDQQLTIRMAEIEQRAEAARQRSEDATLAREAREQAAKESRDLKLRLAQIADAQRRATAEMTRNRGQIVQTDQGIVRVMPDNTVVAVTGANNQPLRPAGTEKAPAGYQWTTTPDGGRALEPIPGGPGEKQAAESAGKSAMLRQARSDIDKAEALIFKPGGGLNVQNISASLAPFGGLGTAGRNLNSYIDNAVSAKYRLETGAAGNKNEEQSIKNRFRVTPLDTAESAREKVDRLREFMDLGIEEMRGKGYLEKVSQPSNKKPWEKDR